MGTTKDEMIGWHHLVSGPEFEQAPGDGEGQGSLAYYSPWSCKELEMTEHLNKNNKNVILTVNPYFPLLQTHLRKSKINILKMSKTVYCINIPFDSKM